MSEIKTHTQPMYILVVLVNCRQGYYGTSIYAIQILKLFLYWITSKFCKMSLLLINTDSKLESDLYKLQGLTK